MIVTRPWVVFVLTTGTVAACGTGMGQGVTGSSASTESCGARSPSSCPSPAPGYVGDVAPLLSRYCTRCHGPGGQESSRSFATYAGAKSFSTRMVSQISACAMPPSGNPQPSTDERDVILTWIVCGAPND